MSATSTPLLALPQPSRPLLQPFFSLWSGMNSGDSGPTATPESELADVPLRPLSPWACPADVRLCGHLRKQKSQRRRFFVLRADPPRLECYESEKKFRTGRGTPKLSMSLVGACTISKRVDARQRHLIVLYTRDCSLGVAAASETEQQAWYSALLEARATAMGEAGAERGSGPGMDSRGFGPSIACPSPKLPKSSSNIKRSHFFRSRGTGTPPHDHPIVPPDPSSHEDPGTWILAPFQDVWPVTLRHKGLGRTRGLGSGGYRLCLGSGVLSLLREPRGRGSRDSQASPPPALRLSLLSVRRCGHADSFFFLELGRSAPTGPGELWLQAPDSVVAQSIHETVLAAMKRLGDGGAGGRAEPLPRDPTTSISRPSSVPQPHETLASEAPSSGLSRRACLGEKNEHATLETLVTLGAAASCPEGLEQAGGHIHMGAGSDYEPMQGKEAGGYMVMAAPGIPAAANAAPCHPHQGWEGTEYMPMSHFPPRSFSSSLPFSYKPGAGDPGHRLQGPSRGIRDSWGTAGAQPCLQPPSELAGEYVCIEYSAQDYKGMGTAIPEPHNGHLNYVDLDLVSPLEARSDAPGASTHSYARIQFQNDGEARVTARRV